MPVKFCPRKAQELDLVGGLINCAAVYPLPRPVSRAGHLSLVFIKEVQGTIANKHNHGQNVG